MYIYAMKSIFRYLRSIVNFSNDIDIEAARQKITASTEFRGSNVWILIFAVAVASVGLNINSIPVVIGAMLISPLMGPVMGIGLSLGINDMGLLRKSFKNLILMTSISIFTAAIYFLITPLSLENPSELLARTNPTVYDVLIAFFSGLAVIVEVCRKEKGTVFAGVAIATALMPQLGTAGFGIANGNAEYFFGAVYLYFINSAFIALAVFLMVRYMKFPLVKISDPQKAKKVHRLITVFTVILVLPSIYTAIMVIRENRFSTDAKAFVEANRTLGNSYIYDYSITQSAGKSLLTLSIAGEGMDEHSLDELKKEAARYGINEKEIEINQNSTYHHESDSELVESIFKQSEGEIRRREELISEMENELRMYREKELPSSQITKELYVEYPQIKSLTLARGLKSELQNGQTQDKEQIVAFIELNGEITREQKMKIRQWLSVRLRNTNIKVITSDFKKQQEE